VSSNMAAVGGQFKLRSFTTNFCNGSIRVRIYVVIEVCSVHVSMSISYTHALIIYGKRYTFHRFLALNSTLIIAEAPNLNGTFVLILIIISLYLMESLSPVYVFTTLAPATCHPSPSNGTHKLQ
jgi:hypothetical protein